MNLKISVNVVAIAFAKRVKFRIGDGLLHTHSEISSISESFRKSGYYETYFGKVQKPSLRETIWNLDARTRYSNISRIRSSFPEFVKIALLNNRDLKPEFQVKSGLLKQKQCQTFNLKTLD